MMSPSELEYLVEELRDGRNRVEQCTRGLLVDLQGAAECDDERLQSLRSETERRQAELDAQEQRQSIELAKLRERIETLQVELQATRQRELETAEDQEAERAAEQLVARHAPTRPAPDPMEVARKAQMKQLQRDAARRRSQLEYAR